MSISTNWANTASTPVIPVLATSDATADSTANITWVASLDQVTVPQMLAQFHARIARPLGPYRSQVDVVECRAGQGRIILRLRWLAEGVSREALRRALTVHVRELSGSLNFTVNSGTAG